MADLEITNNFNSGEVIDATRFNTNYSDVVTYVNNRNSAASTWDAFYATHATTVPLIANNSSGAFSPFQAKDNGSVVFEVFDGGVVSAANQPYVRASFNFNQTITLDGTLVFFNVVTQTGSDYSSGRFTCSANGKYKVDASVSVVATKSGGPPPTASNSIGMYVQKNGSTITSVYPMHSYNPNGSDLNVIYRFSDVLSLAQADYLSFYVNATLYSGETSQYVSLAKTLLTIMKVA